MGSATGAAELENVMALQPIDRSKAKHQFKTAPRKVPQMVNRAHKRVLSEIVPNHVLVSRFGCTWDYLNSNYWRCDNFDRVVW